MLHFIVQLSVSPIDRRLRYSNRVGNPHSNLLPRGRRDADNGQGMAHISARFGLALRFAFLSQESPHTPCFRFDVASPLPLARGHKRSGG